MLTVAGLVPAVAGAGAWYWADQDLQRAAPLAAEPPLAAPLAGKAPVFSLRRAADYLAATRRVAAFQKSLRPFIESLPDRSCFEVTIDGQPVISKSPERPLAPASTLKLVTAAVALEVLGADTVLPTTVSGVVQGGVVQGNLYVKGGGDPVLSVAEYVPWLRSRTPRKYPPTKITSLESLGDQLRAQGITAVTGSVVGDGSLFDTDRYVDTWTPDSIVTEAGPIGGLMVNDVRVFDGARVVAEPPPQRTDPAAAAADQLTRVLQNRRIAVGGPAKAGRSDPAAPLLATITSPPVRDLVAEMLTTSDNNTAEILTKHIGLKAGGRGTWAAGTAAIAAQLDAWGLPADGFATVDGSGLDYSDRVTCRLLTAVLGRAKEGDSLYKGLAVASRSGTLITQFNGTPLDGVLRAKTGTLSIARSLAGFVPTKSGLVRFSFVINVPQGGTPAKQIAQPFWNALAGLLPSPRPGPSPEQLSPESSS